MTIKTYFNTTGDPVTINDDGQTIGGNDWQALDSTEASVKKAVKAGWLVAVEEPEELKQNSPAASAFKDVEKVEAEKAKAKDEKKN